MERLCLHTLPNSLILLQYLGLSIGVGEESGKERKGSLGETPEKVDKKMSVILQKEKIKLREREFERAITGAMAIG